MFSAFEEYAIMTFQDAVFIQKIKVEDPPAAGGYEIPPCRGHKSKCSIDPVRIMKKGFKPFVFILLSFVF